ncbi:hypothetical protein BSKO_12512 [Bryopsis sp. KO-2023]|nr:hypothetical protein BSKO_12512 [Bryopsis sp. KO-2023]
MADHLQKYHLEYAVLVEGGCPGRQETLVMTQEQIREGFRAASVFHETTAAFIGEDEEDEEGALQQDEEQEHVDMDMQHVPRGFRCGNEVKATFKVIQRRRKGARRKSVLKEYTGRVTKISGTSFTVLFPDDDTQVYELSSLQGGGPGGWRVVE